MTEDHKGSVSCYNNNKCRQGPCRRAIALYRRVRRQAGMDLARATVKGPQHVEL